MKTAKSIKKILTNKILAAVSVGVFASFSAVQVFAEETEYANENELQANEYVKENESQETEFSEATEFTTEEEASSLYNFEYGFYNEPEEFRDFKEYSGFKKNRVDIPHRIFEFGFKMDTGVSNNSFAVGDYMKEALVINLKDLADSIPRSGLKLNFSLAPDFFMNLNLKNGFHLGFSSGLEVNSTIGIGKGLFDFIGYGNENTDTIETNASVYADIFTHLDFSVGMDIFGDYHLEVQPALFLPLAHVSSDKSTASLTNESDGTIKFNANADMEILTFVDVERILSGDTSEIPSGLGSGWGFDISSSLDKEIFEGLAVQVYSRIPIVPGTLKYKVNMQASAEGEINALQALVDSTTSGSSSSSGTESGSSSGESGSGSENSESSGNAWSDSIKHSTSFGYESDQNYRLSRPLKIGARARFQPLGEWLTLGGKLGLGVKEPFSLDAKSKFFGEYGVSARIALPVPVIGEILGLEFAHGSEDEYFYNQLKFIFSVRALELNLGAAFQGSNFPSSFNLSGAKAFVYLAFGW